jgi:hypothetical protein
MLSCMHTWHAEGGRSTGCRRHVTDETHTGWMSARVCACVDFGLLGEAWRRDTPHTALDAAAATHALAETHTLRAHTYALQHTVHGCLKHHRCTPMVCA